MMYIPIPIAELPNEHGSIVWTNATGDLEYYYKNMVDDGTLKYAFYDGSAANFQEFASVVFNPNTVFFLIYNKKQLSTPVGHVFLNNFEGFSAMIHFNILREYHKDAVVIGKDGMSYMNKLERAKDIPLVKCFLGLTPCSNRAAIAYVLKLGFTKLGIVEGACRVAYKNKFENGLLTKAVNNETNMA